MEGKVWMEVMLLARGDIMNPRGSAHDPFRPGFEGITELVNEAVGLFNGDIIVASRGSMFTSLCWLCGC